MPPSEPNNTIINENHKMELIAISKGLNVVGTVLLISGIVFWVATNIFGKNYLIQSELIIPASIAIIQLPFFIEPNSASKLYIAHSNLLSTIGIISLPFHVNSSLFLVAGLLMSFFAFFIKDVKEARNTEFIWSNILIALGSYFVFTGSLVIGTPIQVVGIALTTLTLSKTKEIHWTKSSFDYTSYILISLWAWGLTFSIIYWLLITKYYSGFSFLVQGILLMVAVGKIYKGVWPIYSKEKIMKMFQYQ